MDLVVRVSRVLVASAVGYCWQAATANNNDVSKWLAGSIRAFAIPRDIASSVCSCAMSVCFSATLVCHFAISAWDSASFLARIALPQDIVANAANIRIRIDTISIANARMLRRRIV